MSNSKHDWTLIIEILALVAIILFLLGVKQSVASTEKHRIAYMVIQKDDTIRLYRANTKLVYVNGRGRIKIGVDGSFGITNRLTFKIIKSSSTDSIGVFITKCVRGSQGFVSDENVAIIHNKVKGFIMVVSAQSDIRIIFVFDTSPVVETLIKTL